MTASLLALNDLHVTFSTRRGLVEAVRGVSLSLGEGEMLGLVGESGSGKSVTGFAITRLLDAAGRITAGHIRFRGQDITRISAGDFRHLHGAAMAVQISLNLGWAILNAAGLSFIGLGVKPPTPEWGIMVAEGARFISTGKWWLVAFPGLALMLTVLCFNLLGDGVRDILDPRMRT